MHFDHQTLGEYQIHATARESTAGRYLAGVSVTRLLEGEDLPRQVFVRDAVGGPYFESPAAALAYAMTVGRRHVRQHADKAPPMLNTPVHAAAPGRAARA